MSRKERIKELLTSLESPESLLNLLHYLGLKTFKTSQKPRKESFNLRKEERKIVEDIYFLSDYNGSLRIYLMKTKENPGTTIIRSLSELFLRTVQYPFLIFTDNYRHFHFVVVERKRIERDEFHTRVIKLDVDSQKVRRTPIDVISKIDISEDDSPRKIFNNLRVAFDIEEVTEKFFKDYDKVFKSLKEHFIKQKENRVDIHKEAHEYTHQLLNRIMFIYFVQKKGWLGEDYDFIETYWEEFRRTGDSEHKFHKHWLDALFFEAFNKKFGRRQYLPKEINDILIEAPYLNGGLFQRNRFDRIGFRVSDEQFKDIFDFFSNYNFTIQEDTPLYKNVAVDPEMIGKVYESLVNVSEESKERGEGGIFYTDRVEIELMVKKSLVEYLCMRTEIPRKKIIEFIFTPLEVASQGIDKRINEWNEIKIVLDNLKILDPACGSGSFLLGALNILTELYKRIYEHSPRKKSPFDIKKEIIKRSLYGVDVMEWAMRVAELRLWLQLVIESDLSKSELQFEPLLPNLSFKLRQGDSLIQEVAGVNLAKRDIPNKDIPSQIKRRITNLIKDKRRYFNAEEVAKSFEMIQQEQFNIFKDLFRQLMIKTQQEIQKWEQKEPTVVVMKELFGESVEKKRKKQRELFEEERNEKVKSLKQDLVRYEEVYYSLETPEKTPFVWDIDFPEIFFREDSDGGFDIVIGNPPYVRQENIKPPEIPTPSEDATSREKELFKEKKKEYKKKLQDNIIEKYGKSYKPSGRSDLYLYFYLFDFDLLKENGILCLITSNSWLDVGYGSVLQEFFLDKSVMKEIIDNSAKRSFKSADINTVITCVTKSKKGVNPLENTTRFVVFKKPFEEVIKTDVMLTIEDFEEVEGYSEEKKIHLEGTSFNLMKTDDYRKVTIGQKSLKYLGWDFKGEKPEIDDFSEFSKGKYKGEKWGGKFIRAPDIFYRILEKGEGKLVRLGDIADVQRGFTTGANEFFYLPSKYYNLEEERDTYKLIPKQNDLPSDLRIEKKYLKPVIKSPRECKLIIVKEEDLKYKVFLCHKSKEELKGEKALEYIKWGENKNFHVESTCASRNRWWRLNDNLPSDFLWIMTYRKRFFVLFNNNVLADARFYDIYCKIKDELNMGLILNSTLTLFYIELMSRNYGGGGGPVDVKVYEVEDMLIADPSKIIIDNKKNLIKGINNVFESLGFNESKVIREQEPNPLPNRKKLDNIIFDELGLTEEERIEVYYATAELVQQRLQKAKSV